MADCTEVLSELYLALLGEQCIFTKPRITGLELRINEEVVQRLLPLEQYQDVVRVAELSGYVRVIECLYKKRNFGAETSPIPLPESEAIKSKNISQDDAIKKAIVESILANYNVYVNSADKMRSEHICAKGKHSVGDLFYFTAIWHKRLRFVRHLIKIVEENNGMRTMNMIFQEWASMFCCKDWEHRLLEHALHQASKALLNVCAAWLLDGNLLGATSWMIASEQAKSPSRRSCNSFSTSFNSISSMEPFNTSQVVKNDSPQKVDKIPAEVLLVDPELIPTALAHCPELTNLILDVGKKVRFLKMLRRCRSYEHRLEERKLLIDSLKPEIWYRTAQRGALHLAVQKLHRIVCQDILFELMQRQRLVDHLTLVHSYFFNLRGELFAELERTIQVTFIKPSSLYYQTPMSVRKRSSNSTKMPELIMNQALSRCSPPSNIADLMSLLSTNRASRDKSKSFFESFGISYDVSKANGRRTREGRSSQFGNFFSRRLINIYERVFKNVANLQLLRFHLDEISHRFTHNTCPKVRSRKGKFCQPLTTFIHFHLNFLRQFLTRLGNYMFEEVLLLESAKILGAIQRETDPHGLLCQHENQLSTIMRALFIYSGAAPVSEILLATIRNGRAFVDAVENFCDAIDKNCQQQQKPQTPLSMHEENNNGRSAKIEITALGRQGRKTRISSDQLGKVEQHLFTLQDSSTQFKSSHLQLRTILEQCLGDGSKQQSIYWPKLHSLLFDHH